MSGKKQAVIFYPKLSNVEVFINAYFSGSIIYNIALNSSLVSKCCGVCYYRNDIKVQILFWNL